MVPIASQYKTIICIVILHGRRLCEISIKIIRYNLPMKYTSYIQLDVICSRCHEAKG